MAATSGSRYDPVHNYVHSAGSTISSERTNSGSNSNSTLYTSTTATAGNTAAPSLVSSNGQYDYDTVGQKRKRTTRQQAADSKKRDREMAAMGLTFANYRPPPLPPVKAAEVDVKVIRDVRSIHPSKQLHF